MLTALWGVMPCGRVYGPATGTMHVGWMTTKIAGGWCERQGGGGWSLGGRTFRRRRDGLDAAVPFDWSRSRSVRTLDDILVDLQIRQAESIDGLGHLRVCIPSSCSC